MLISYSDLPTLARGGDFLGSGGGGNANILLNMSQAYLKQYGPVNVIDLEQLDDNSLIVPIAMVGSPSVSNKKDIGIAMFEEIIKKIQTDFSEKNIVLMPAEIGGCNALAPFAVAAKLNLPILDADLIGRAFPKVSMCVPAIKGGYCDIAYMANDEGHTVKFNFSSVEELEMLARQHAVNFGGSAVVTTFLYFYSSDLKSKMIVGSITRALELGNEYRNFLAKNNFIGSGKIIGLEAKVENGFLLGKAVIAAEAGPYFIYFQNEFLLCTNYKELFIESPALIVLLDSHTLLPIASELLEVGMHVNIISLPAPDFWYEAENLTKVSGQVFDFAQ